MVENPISSKALVVCADKSKVENGSRPCVLGPAADVSSAVILGLQAMNAADMRIDGTFDDGGYGPQG